MTVLAHDVGLGRKSVAHIRYITKIDGGIPNDLDREVVQFGDGPHAGVQSNVVFELTHLCRSGRQNQHGYQLRPQEILSEVVQLLLGESISGKAQLQDGHARSAVVNN